MQKRKVYLGYLTIRKMGRMYIFLDMAEAKSQDYSMFLLKFRIKNLNWNGRPG